MIQTREEAEATAELIKKSVKHRKAKKLPVAISYEEFAQLIKSTKQVKHKIAFLLSFGAGLRVSEVVKLEKRHFNLANKSILIEQGKGARDRIVPIPKGFKEDYIKMFPLKYKNTKAGIRSLQKAFHSACLKAGLLEVKPTIHYHSLRHGFATRCVSKGIPIHHVRTLLGHSNISTTNVYLESNPKAALESFEELF